MEQRRSPKLSLNGDLARTDTVDWRTLGVDPDSRSRMIGCLDSVLRSMDRRWFYVVARDGSPIYQSTALQRRLMIEACDYSWLPEALLDSERIRVDDTVLGQTCHSRTVGQMTVASFGELEVALPPLDAPRVPPLESADIDEFVVALASSTWHTNWHVLSFDPRGVLDPLSPGALKRLGLSPDESDWSWIPSAWATGSHDIVDVVRLPDGRELIATGELVQHENGNLAVFQLCSASGRPSTLGPVNRARAE